MRRQFEAPDKEWLTLQESALWLNVPEGTLEGLIKTGAVPPLRAWSKKEKRWHWEVVVAISIFLKFNHFPLEEMAE